MKKIANSCIWGPTMRAILDKQWSRPRGQLGLILTFNNIFLYKIKYSRGVYITKKLTSRVARVQCGGSIWSNAQPWLPTDHIWVYHNFFDHFEFKMQNDQGSILCKKLLQTKIGIVSFVCQPTAKGRNFFIKYFYFIF